MTTKPKSKRERATEILQTMPGRGVKLASEMATVQEDGQTLHGTEWVTPEDYADEDVSQGLLPGMKGATMTTLPTMNAIEEGW